jgi:hypothetical protein
LLCRQAEESAAREKAEAAEAKAIAARERAEANVAMAIAEKERAEADVTKAIAQKEQAEARAEADILRLKNELAHERLSIKSGQAEENAANAAANAELQREAEDLKLQLHTMKTENLDNIERAKKKEVGALTNQLAQARTEITALIHAKDLLERGPEDEHEAVEDAKHVHRMAEKLTQQRELDIKAATSYSTATAAVASLLAACAVGSLITLAYYVPTMPVATATAGRRALATSSDPTRVAWTKFALDSTALIMLLVLLIREYTSSKAAAGGAAGSDPRVARLRLLQDMLLNLDSMKEEQRMLCARLDGELAADDDAPPRISCWRATLLKLLEEHTERSTTPPIEDEPVPEDGPDGDEEDTASPELLEKQRLQKERRLRTPEIIAQEESISDKLLDFGFVVPVNGAVGVATQLVQQHVLGGGSGSGHRLQPLMLAIVVFAAALVLDGIGVGVSGDAAAALASATVSVGETCTISGDTLGGMVRMGIASVGAVVATVLAVSAVASRRSKTLVLPDNEVEPCLPAWRPKMHVLNRLNEKGGIDIVICAHEQHRVSIVLENLGDSELRVKWAATDVEWARPLYPNDRIAERDAWPHADLSYASDLAPQVGRDGYEFAVVGKPDAKTLGAKFCEHGELLHEVRVPMDEQRLDPKRNRLELGLSFFHTEVGDCYKGTLLVHSNDPIRKYREIPITLSVQVPLMRLDVNIIEVTAPWNGTVEARITIKNDGKAPLRIEEIDIKQADFITTAYTERIDEPAVFDDGVGRVSLVVEPDEMKLLTFVIKKTQAGSCEGWIALQTNDKSLNDSGISGRKDLPVDLLVVKPQLRTEPSTLNFAVARDMRANKLVRLYNDGGAPAEITDLVVDANSRGWVYPMADQIPVTVGPNSFVELGMRCVGPSDDGGGWERHSHLTMIADESAHKLPIELEVLLPRVRVEPGEMVVAIDGTWENSFQYDYITLTNEGDATLTITEITSEVFWADIAEEERTALPLTLEPKESRRVTARFCKPPPELVAPKLEPEPEPDVELELEPEPEILADEAEAELLASESMEFADQWTGVTVHSDPVTGTMCYQGTLSVICNDPHEKTVLLPVKMAVGQPKLKFDERGLSVRLHGSGGTGSAAFVEKVLHLTNEGTLDAKITSLGVDRNSSGWASVYFRDETTNDDLPASQLPAGFLLKPGRPALKVTVRFEKMASANQRVAFNNGNADAADATVPQLPAGELEHFVVPCPTEGCEETLTLTADTDPSLRCRECQRSVSDLVDKIKAAAQSSSTLQVELPGVGALTSCRCPDPCGAYVTFPIENTIFCPVCVEQVLEPTVTPDGDAVVNAYTAPNAASGRTGVQRQELPAPGGGVESSFLARHPDDLDDSLLDGLEDENTPADMLESASEFNGFLQVLSNDPEQRMMSLPLKMELQAPLLAVEPSAITAEIARGDQTSRTLTLRNDGEGALVLRNVEAVDAHGQPLPWATPVSASAAISERALLEPGKAMQVTVRFQSDAGGEHSGILRLRSDSAKRQTVNVPLTLKVVAPKLKWEIEDRPLVQGQSTLFNSQALDVPVSKDAINSVVLRIRAGSSAPLKLHSVGSTAKWASLHLLNEHDEVVPRPEDAAARAANSPFKHLLIVDSTLPGMKDPQQLQELESESSDGSFSTAVRIDLSSRATDGVGVGEHTAQLAISSDDPAQSTMVIPLRMKVLAPRIHIDKPLLNLDLGVGKDSLAIFHIKNTGGAELNIEKVERSDDCKSWATVHVGGFGSTSEGPWKLKEAADPLEVAVQVRHNTGGKATGWLTVHSDDSVAPTRVVQICLNVDTPKLRVEPQTITTGRASASSAPGSRVKKTLRLYNDGTVPLTVSTLIADDDCNGWCMVETWGMEGAMEECLRQLFVAAIDADHSSVSRTELSAKLKRDDGLQQMLKDSGRSTHDIFAQLDADGDSPVTVDDFLTIVKPEKLVLPLTIEPKARPSKVTVYLSSSAPEGATGSILVGSNDGSTPSLSIPIIFKEPRLRLSRESIVARVGASTQCMLTICGGSDTNKLRDERIALYNEGQAPLEVTDVTIQDADWATVVPAEDGVQLKGMNIDPMSPPAELIIRIDASARKSHSLEGMIYISTTDPRPGPMQVPLKVSSTSPFRFMSLSSRVRFAAGLTLLRFAVRVQVVLAPLCAGICSPYPSMKTNLDSGPGKRLPKLVGGRCDSFRRLILLCFAGLCACVCKPHAHGTTPTCLIWCACVFAGAVDG